jgi:asparagine synthase (glutamine-hydrolysing)
VCGICGWHAARPIQEDDIIRMTRRLEHRGPDDEGVYVQGNIGLGHRRLSIIDLEGGRQPMSNGEESLWIVFNGEIYNYRELRRRLQVDGQEFRHMGWPSPADIRGTRPAGAEALLLRVAR